MTMKNFLGASLFLAVSGVALAQDSRPRVTSPEVHADRTVTFRLFAPDAKTVVLTGEFQSGSRHLERNPSGLWSLTIGPIEPEMYHYNFTIDGVRTIDPGNAELKTGSTPSTLASILEVRGSAPFFYDPQPVPHGEIRTHWYQSKSLGTTRRVTVYTPPGYDRSPASRYPTLYLFHGANADENAWYRLGRANLILDNLLASGTIKPFVVVMPFGYGVPPLASSAPGENTTKFGRDLLDDLIPFIESTYRVVANREQRAIVGLSMGGGQALSIGLNHLEVFSHVAGFSSGLGAVSDFPNTYASLIAHPDVANKKLRLLWVGCGTDDGAFEASRRFSGFLDEHHVTHTFHASGGAHTWMVWRRYLNEVAPLLFR